MFAECNDKLGRELEICSGKSGLSRHETNKYRKVWGLQPISEEDWMPASKTNAKATVRRSHTSRPEAAGHSCRTCKKSLAEKLIDRATQLAASAVDFVRDGMHVATEEQQQSRIAICEACPIYKDGWCDANKGGCGCNLSLKVKARSAYCPQGKWFAHTDNYRPLVNPTRSLIFHLYPKLKAECNWHWHIEQIRKHQDTFNGKIVIAVGVDSGTATIEEVQRLAAGIRVTKWIRADNTKALAETHTHVALMSEVQSNDPNAIVFRYHTKGVTKTPNAVEQRWAALLWQVNMDIQAVEDALASHMTCGAMRSLKPLVSKKPGDFFFAGSAYWFRAADAFQRDWTWTEPNRWIVEYVPCHLFNRHESTCLMYDLTESSVISEAYFAKHVQPEWDQWKFARGIE